ncbi:MAG: ferritin [Candidatus Micrarchaeota archaeon]|nr:ferritin [Candidatus Micrarchaeota archaeon]
MKISKDMASALNKQINEEISSGYLYMAMAAYFDSISLKGFASWMKKQASEEWGHAMKMYEFVFERGGSVVMEKIETPQAKWASPLAAFEDAHKHEMYITEKIDGLVKLARKENDIATENFLQWYISEQVEEEASTDEIVQKLKMIEGSKNGLYMLDKELFSRK